MATTRIYPNLTAFFEDNPGETVTGVARDCDCVPSYISMIKWGERQPALPLAIRISHRCRVPLESLVRKPLKKAS
jgi:hypothetical protein